MRLVLNKITKVGLPDWLVLLHFKEKVRYSWRLSEGSCCRDEDLF